MNAPLAHTVDLVADPGLPAAIADKVAEDVAGALCQRALGRGGWNVRVQCRRIEADDGGWISLSELAAAEWLPKSDAVVFLTDQPRRERGVPVVADTCHGTAVALISLPALGAFGLSRRTTRAVTGVVDAMLDANHQPGVPSPGSDIPSVRGTMAAPTGIGHRYMGSPLRGRLRLLAGMVRANRPWQLVPRLSGAFAAAVATGGLVLVNSSVWKLSAKLSADRLVAATVLAVMAMVAWLIIDHRMWERAADHDRREPIGLYNLTTAVTLGIGVLTLYVGLWGAELLAQWVVIDRGVFRQSVGHGVGWADRATFAWLAASMATVGGALGTGFESDEAVRMAAYGFRQRERRRKQDEARDRREAA